MLFETLKKGVKLHSCRLNLMINKSDKKILQGFINVDLKPFVERKV